MSTAAVTVPFHFKREQAKVLDAIADRLEQADVPAADIGLFRQAADHARTGEALDIVFESRHELEQMVAAFVLAGAEQPAVG